MGLVADSGTLGRASGGHEGHRKQGMLGGGSKPPCLHQNCGHRSALLRRIKGVTCQNSGHQAFSHPLRHVPPFLSKLCKDEGVAWIHQCLDDFAQMLPSRKGSKGCLCTMSIREGGNPGSKGQQQRQWRRKKNGVGMEEGMGSRREGFGEGQVPFCSCLFVLSASREKRRGAGRSATGSRSMFVSEISRRA